MVRVPQRRREGRCGLQVGRRELRRGGAAPALDVVQGRRLGRVLPEQRDERDDRHPPVLRLLLPAAEPLPPLDDGGAHQAADQPRALVLRGRVADGRAEPDAAGLAQVREAPRRDPRHRPPRRALHGQDAEDLPEGLLADVPRGRAGHAGGQVVPGDRGQRAGEERRCQDAGHGDGPQRAAGLPDKRPALLHRVPASAGLGVPAGSPRVQQEGQLLLPRVRRLLLRALL
mmetsp:Transcript_80447/g.260671  ORF Transcript_80447/g.260671 Transcript_80447/m.260671 type:complete len:229 (+) Transcript_80447:661-1347(+)